MTTAWLVAIAVGCAFLIWGFWRGLALPPHRRGGSNDNFPGGEPGGDGH